MTEHLKGDCDGLKRGLDQNRSQMSTLSSLGDSTDPCKVGAAGAAGPCSATSRTKHKVTVFAQEPRAVDKRHKSSHHDMHGV